MFLDNKIVIPMHPPAESFKPILVWVNPPPGYLETFMDLSNTIAQTVAQYETYQGDDLRIEINLGLAIIQCAESRLKMLRDFWNQGPMETRWSGEDIKRLQEDEIEGDGFQQLMNNTVTMIRRHTIGRYN